MSACLYIFPCLFRKPQVQKLCFLTQLKLILDLKKRIRVPNKFWVKRKILGPKGLLVNTTYVSQLDSSMLHHCKIDEVLLILLMTWAIRSPKPLNQPKAYKQPMCQISAFQFTPFWHIYSSEYLRQISALQLGQKWLKSLGWGGVVGSKWLLSNLQID